MTSHGATGTPDGEIRTPPIRDVVFHDHAGRRVPEFVDLATLRRRGGAEEFVAPQRLDFELLVRIEAGSTKHEVDFHSFRLAPGDVLWVHAGQVQRWGEIDRLDGDVLLFTADLLPVETARRLAAFGAMQQSHWPGAAREGTLLAAAFAGVRDWFGRLAAEPALTSSAREAVREHLLWALLLQVAGDPSTVLRASPPEPAFRELTERIEADFARERSVAYYADALRYSEKTLNRLARRNAGASVKELIDRRVVLEAQRLLAHTSFTAAQVGASLGFTDAANFSAFFRHRVGTTPVGFRRAHTTTDD